MEILKISEIERVPEYLGKNHDHPVWKPFGEKCFSCDSTWRCW